MKRHKAVMQPTASINVTSLLDITFVLLIAFMIVAPALKYGVDIDLPEVSEAPVIKEARPVQIAVKPGISGSQIFVDGQAVELDVLVERVKAVSTGENVRPVTLEGDRSVDWQHMAEVIAELRAGGVTQIGIVTQRKET